MYVGTVLALLTTAEAVEEQAVLEGLLAPAERAIPAVEQRLLHHLPRPQQLVRRHTTHDHVLC
eukprot:29502-Eustigmatos_ZCMA.PRE.1